MESSYDSAGILSPVHSSKTPVRVSERKTKQEKMYARHGKMLAFFPPICYDEITLNSKEKKTCKGTSLQGHREFRGIFRTVENGAMQEGKSGSDSGKRETFLRVRLAPLPVVKEEKVMGEMMWALVKEKADVGLWMKKVPVPMVGKNDVKIKIHKTAICGTDVHIYNWNEWAQHTIPVGLTAGHEYVGEIVEVGENVEGFKVGDLVSGEGHIVCGKCRNCLAGMKHLCKNTQGVGVNRNGAFAEYLVIPAANAWHCDPSIREELYSIFDPLGNAVHTALSFDMVGEDVLITGAGPIGIMAAAISRHVGARHVVITDMNDYRLDLAKKMGATRTVNVSKENLPDVMKEIGMKEGFDVGLEMSGSQPGFNNMVDNMKNGGKIALLGLQKADARINWEKVIFNGLTIRGIYGRKVWETWYKMSTMLQSGLNVDDIITHRFDVRDYEKGFEAMNSGMSGKVILDWTKLEAEEEA